MVAAKVGATWFSVDKELALDLTIFDQLEAHVDGFCCFWLMESLKNPSAIELLTRRGMEGCEWTILQRLVRIETASWILIKVAAILASVAEAMKSLMILETVKMGQLRLV